LLTIDRLDGFVLDLAGLEMGLDPASEELMTIFHYSEPVRHLASDVRTSLIDHFHFPSAQDAKQASISQNLATLPLFDFAQSLNPFESLPAVEHLDFTQLNHLVARIPEIRFLLPSSCHVAFQQGKS
jgi:hypothetical protein